MKKESDKFKALGKECFDKMKEMNPSGGIREYIRIAAEYGYKKALEDKNGTEVVVTKGQESNKLLLMKELMEPLREGFFEQVKNENADAAKKMFGADNKIVATKDFTVKLIVNYED